MRADFRPPPAMPLVPAHATALAGQRKRGAGRLATLAIRLDGAGRDRQGSLARYLITGLVREPDQGSPPGPFSTGLDSRTRRVIGRGRPPGRGQILPLSV